MDAITGKRCSSMGTAALALVLCVLAQASLSSSSQFGYDDSLETPHFPSLPHLPPLSLPKLPFLPLPELHKFSLPPLPSKVTFPGVKFPGFAIPTKKAFEHLHFPALPAQKIHIPKFPGFKLPSHTIFPHLPSWKLPDFSQPPTPAKTFTIPKFKPDALTIPGLLFLKLLSLRRVSHFPDVQQYRKPATKKNKEDISCEFRSTCRQLTPICLDTH